jgi:hypothetical protein
MRSGTELKKEGPDAFPWKTKASQYLFNSSGVYHILFLPLLLLGDCLFFIDAINTFVPLLHLCFSPINTARNSFDEMFSGAPLELAITVNAWA